MKNPMDLFMLIFVVLIMLVGIYIYISLDAQKDLREMRYFDSAGTEHVTNIA